jgi:hypothetical protein
MNNLYAKVKVYHGFLHLAVEDYPGSGTSWRIKTKRKRRISASSTDPNVACFKLIDDLSRTNKFRSNVRSMDLKQSPRSVPRDQMDRE